MPICVSCPAKVNSFLSVGPRDSSGYHPIRTVFQAIGLFDELLVDISTGEPLIEEPAAIHTFGPHTIESDWAEFPEQNTLRRVLELVGQDLPLPALRIALRKRIPSESGLGGGSSDAAGLLRALPRFSPKSFEPGEAERIAAQVGADVPFFLVGGRAKGEGYGEKLEALDDPSERWLLIARPEAGVSTRNAYADLDKSRDHGAWHWREFPEDLDTLYNDFESIAPDESLQLAKRLHEMGATQTQLAGSGSAVFTMFDQWRAAARLRQKLWASGVRHAWIAPTLAREESLWIS